MQSMADTRVKNFRSIVVKIKNGTTITGKLNIGNFPRVSDFSRNHRIIISFYPTPSLLIRIMIKNISH